MSQTEDLSPRSDELSDSSVGVGVNKTREEYLKSFARPCASPQYERTYTSPISGFYTMANSSTSLILLNQRFKNSHLRESILFEESSNVSGDGLENQSSLLTSRSRSKIPPKSTSLNATIDPNRHFQNSFCERPKRSISIDNRSFSILSQPQTAVTGFQTESSWEKSFLPSYAELEVQRYSTKAIRKRRDQSREKQKKTFLNKNQELFLLTKTRIYDNRESKVRRANSYSQILCDRLKSDNRCKPKYRLTDPVAWSKYVDYLDKSRTKTISSFSIRSTEIQREPTNTEIYSTASINASKFSLTRPSTTGQAARRMTTIQV